MSKHHKHHKREEGSKKSQGFKCQTLSLIVSKVR